MEKRRLKSILFASLAALFVLSCRPLHQDDKIYNQIKKAVIEKKFIALTKLLQTDNLQQRHLETTKALSDCVGHKDRTVQFLALFVLDKLTNTKNNEIKKQLIENITKDFDRSNFIIAAPDGSKVCPWGIVMNDKGASAVYILMGNEGISYAIRHNTYSETWITLSGEGEMKLKDKSNNITTVSLKPGVSVAISAQTDFQFRNTNKQKPLKFLTLTSPPWSGEGDVEFRKPIYGDSTYDDPQKLDRDLDDRNILRKTFIDNLGNTNLAICKLKEKWILKEDKACFARIKCNTQNALEHALEMIRFYRSIEALRDNFYSHEFLLASLDEETKNIILEGFEKKEICSNIHLLVKFFMKKLKLFDEVVLYERWHGKLQKVLTENTISLENYDLMIPALIEKMNP